MMLHKIYVALVVTVAALAGAAIVNSAPAATAIEYGLIAGMIP